MLFELLMSPSPSAVISPPTGFSATTTGATQITLNWTNASGGLQTEIWRGGLLYDTVLAGTTSYVDNAIAAGTEYPYKIRHKSGSDFSVFTATLTRSGSPPAPSQGTPSVSTDDVTVSWTQTATTQTAVRVYRDGVNVSGDLAAGATSYVDNNLANATYTYTIRNTNGVAESVDSNSQNAVVNYNPPLTDPSGFTATATHSDRNALSWTNGDATAQTEIYRGTSPNPTTLIATKSAGVTSHNDDGLNQTTLYYYRIRHVKGGSISGYVSDSETTLTTSFNVVNLAADVGLDDIVVDWTLTNPPVTPSVWHGNYSDTLGEESVTGPVPGITSPHTVVSYSNGIVTKGSGTDCTGTLTYLRVYGSGNLLAELTNLTVNFDVGAP